MSAEPRKSEKQPGEQSTQPIMCSVAFWNQYPIAYSNFWYHTIGPAVCTVTLVLKTCVNKAVTITKHCSDNNKKLSYEMDYFVLIVLLNEYCIRS